MIVHKGLGSLVTMNRILIYHHFDPSDIIDDHVIYFLKAFRAEGCDISFGSNSNLSQTEVAKLDELADKVTLRENRGFDFASWRDQLQSHGKEGLEAYDQVIIANSTTYGPLFPLGELFTSLETQSFDFWAPTLHTAAYGIPLHVQPYVLIVRKRLHQSEVFWDFWNSIQDDYKDQWDIICKAEIRLTYEFCKGGFNYAVGAKLDDTNEVRALGHYEPFVLHAAALHISESKLCFVKVKAFYHYDARPLQQTPFIFEALKKQESRYPENLIVEHQRRTSPLSWHKNLPGTMIGDNLSPLQVVQNDGVKESAQPSDKPIGVFAHIYYPDSFNYLKKYLKNIPTLFDMNITTPDETLVDLLLLEDLQRYLPKLCSIEIRVVENRGRDIAPWVLDFRDKQFDYDIAIKLHVKRHSNQPRVFGQIWNDYMFESLLGNKTQVKTVLDSFSRDSRLGIAFPTYPPFYNLIYPRGYWGSGEDQSWRQKILTDLQCEVPEESSQPIFSAGGMSWYRPEALRRLFESEYKLKDFPSEPFPLSGTIGHGLERAIPYIAQSDGFSFRTLMPGGLLRRSFLLYEDRIMSSFSPTGQLPGPVTDSAPPGVRRSLSLLRDAARRSLAKRRAGFFYRLRTIIGK